MYHPMTSDVTNERDELQDIYLVMCLDVEVDK